MLGILVLVPIALSISLDIEVEVEVEGMVPWRRVETAAKLKAAGIDPDED